jgi:hypothetical protein
MARRAEGFALGAAMLLVAAFAVSFVSGLFRGEASSAAPPSVVTRDAAPEPAAGVKGRVEVLNAARRAGLARRATEALRAAGFDVVYFGNAPASAPDSSVVIDRVGAPEVARAAAAALGIATVRSEPDSALLVDATVLVGVDWGVHVESTGASGSDGVLSRLRRSRPFGADTTGSGRAPGS